NGIDDDEWSPKSDKHIPFKFDAKKLAGKEKNKKALLEQARLPYRERVPVIGLVSRLVWQKGFDLCFEALPALKGARWVAIGRLDINTSGLLLLTTDGELANALMHPSFEVEREYVCRVRAPEGQDNVSEDLVERLRRGVALEDGQAKFDEIEQIGGSGVHDRGGHDWFRVLLKEGRNREVRRLWESQGCQVSRLKRIRYGTVDLPRELLRGHSQELPTDRVEKLRLDLGLEDAAPSALTLQPVIGQRKAAKSTINLSNTGDRTSGYVSGHNSASDEGRELRRFDHVREDRGRGRGAPTRHGGLTVSGEAAAKQAHKPFKQRQDKGSRALPEGNPAAFRTWYVPEGVDTGPSGHRNADGRGPKKPYGKKPGGRPGGGGGTASRGRSERGPGGGQGQGQRGARQHTGAPSFPSDHANPGSFNPYGDKPRAPRPAGSGKPGPRPGGKPAGKPGGKPSGKRRGGRGPRGDG
ncbi:MAG: pseudouridine synthase, partial [Proteobacteria bacterium]|nr:pseudouridine synthase [Pseudomonadota bacterium]